MRSLRWRQDFIRTCLERDVTQIQARVPAETLRRFWFMLAHLQGTLLNVAEVGRSLGMDVGPDQTRWAIEIKRGLTMPVDRGFHQACEDLRPSRRFVVHGGTDRFRLGKDLEAISLRALAGELAGVPMPARNRPGS